ncbi:MAG TPA: VOC family protein [Candidatus Limnocylindria bacterium]|nr:VOC family protein [Candidatus Limnocylindria bacterium]
MPRIFPMLWFNDQADEAAKFYTSIFPNSKIGTVTRYGPDSPGPEGSLMTIDFELDGNPFVALNGGPDFTFSEAISFVIPCADQAEIDRYWDRLVDGGEPAPCGWLKDRFGVSWQVIPAEVIEWQSDADPERARRVSQVVLGTFGKLDLEKLRAAYEGEPVSAASR